MEFWNSVFKPLRMSSIYQSTHILVESIVDTNDINMEVIADALGETCAGNVCENVPESENRHNIAETSEDHASNYLTASDLFSMRGIVLKNQGNSEDTELYKGPKLYHPNDVASSNEIVESIHQDTKKSLELQRIAKNRDCAKAEWNEELKMALVPHLKKKTTQHMGINVKGKCALFPEECLFLLEKGSIEVVHNKMSLSVEEAYSVMLKEKLAVEKYEVYSFLSQQGFMVIHHKSRDNSNFEKIVNLSEVTRKRKANGESVDIPEQKRLTFTNILASNSEKKSVNTEHCASSNTEDVLNIDDNNKLEDASGKINLIRSEDDTVSFDSASHVEITDSTEKQGNTVKNKENDDLVCSNDMRNCTSVNRSASVEMNYSSNVDERTSGNLNGDKEINVDNVLDDNTIENDHDDTEKENDSDDNEIDIESVDNEKENKKSDHRNEMDVEIDVENLLEKDRLPTEKAHGDNGNDLQHIDVIDVEDVNDNEVHENLTDGDTNEVIIDEEPKTDKIADINVEDSLSNCYNNKEYISSDDSMPLICDESNDQSIDVYSCSPGVQQSSKADNLPSDDQDDDVTLVEVKKKEKTPLAVIDLLSDDENDTFVDQNREDTGDKDGSSSEEMFEDSDDEIQVVDVVPVSNNNPQGTSRNRNSVKLESKNFKFPVNPSDVKSAYVPQLKFPDAFRKDIICVPRPPSHLLPLHVQPNKELYVISPVKSQPRQSRVWNSYKDIQDYQRDRRSERHMNSRFHPFRDQNDTYSNQVLPFNTAENSRDTGFNRNNQNFFYQQHRNLHQSTFNQPERPSLLPVPNAFNPPSHMPFTMNMHSLQSLSSSNPAAFVNEIQKTVYNFANNMISSMLGQQFNPNTSSPTPSSSFSEPGMMGFTSHLHSSNFSSSPGVSGPMSYNSSGRNDHPVRFPSERPFSGERYSSSSFEYFSPGNNWRGQNNFRQRNFAPRGPLFPCTYRTVRKKRDWHDVKAAVEGTVDSDSGSDIVEVPINLNQFLWSNDIQPLVKPGSKLPVGDVLKALQITQRANLSDAKRSIERYLPVTLSLEISFDVYLPNSKYKRSEPSPPKCRVIVVRSSDPIPRYSELVYLQRKWNDGASLQVAVVDHGDINFYSFNNVMVPEIVPFES